MAIDITKLMFKYEKRMKMRDSATYQKLKELWNNSLLSDIKNTGDCDYLVRQYIEKNQKQEMDRKTWAKYYMQTGENRKRTIENTKTYFDKEKDKYYGRTLENIYQIAEAFIVEIADKIKIDIAGALNFVYCVIVDETYLKYLKIYDNIKILEEKNSNINFSLSDPYAYTKQGIDLFGSDQNNELVLGIKLVPEGYVKDEIIEQKDSIFESIYNCSVNYITIDENYNFIHN